MVMLLTQGKSGSQIVPIHVYIEVAVFSGVVGAGDTFSIQYNL